MFGSLVVLLPFEHEGGNLLLRHRRREYDFNGPALLKDAPPASVAYIAFFSDVEHEVAQVTSGYRVTVTYNLYFDSKKGVPTTQVSSDIQPDHPFKTILRTCLDNTATQPVPEFLGFGLAHAYAFGSIFSKSGLKGSDALLIKTLRQLNIPHDYFTLYRAPEGNNRCPFRVLSMKHIDGHSEEEGYGESVFDTITSGKGSFLVWDDEIGKKPPRYSAWYNQYNNEKQKYKSMDVKWVTEPNEEYLDRSTVLAYGNESTLQYYYHQLCVIAVIPQTEEGTALAGSGVFSGCDVMDEDEEEEEEHEL